MCCVDCVTVWSCSSCGVTVWLQVVWRDYDCSSSGLPDYDCRSCGVTMIADRVECLSMIAARVSVTIIAARVLTDLLLQLVWIA